MANSFKDLTDALTGKKAPAKKAAKKRAAKKPAKKAVSEDTQKRLDKRNAELVKERDLARRRK